MTKFTERLVSTAEEEWTFFGRQERDIQDHLTRHGHKENEAAPFWERIGRYWDVVGQNGWDGRTNQPWSAAFISYVMQVAGAGQSFPYAAAHRIYIQHSIKSLKNQDETAAYWGYPINQVNPMPGDLIGCGRAENSSIKYESLPFRFKSHCDLVVAVGDGWLEVIGGNVSNSVTRRRIAAPNGQLQKTSNDPWFVVMKCRMDFDGALIASVDVPVHERMALA